MHASRPSQIGGGDGNGGDKRPPPYRPTPGHYTDRIVLSDADLAEIYRHVGATRGHDHKLCPRCQILLTDSTGGNAMASAQLVLRMYSIQER